MRIGVDLMGSESSPLVLFDAVLKASQSFSNEDSFVVFLTKAAQHKLLSEKKFQSLIDSRQASIDLHPVEDEIVMEDNPLAVIRQKKKASLVVGIDAVREGQVDALVSAGNTGALIAYASIKLEPLQGINRPCLIASLPTKNGSMAVLDVGGFLNATPEMFVQYAYAGAAYQRALHGILRPNVGLMNIGVEEMKGTPGVRSAFQLISREKTELFHFIGNVEGRDFFLGGIDVLVTDGFTGNIVLKVSQGISIFIFQYLKDVIAETSSVKEFEVVDRLYRHFRYDEYPGAFICGVKGVIVKCHGASTANGMLQSIIGAKQLVEHDVIAHMKNGLP